MNTQKLGQKQSTNSHRYTVTVSLKMPTLGGGVKAPQNNIPTLEKNGTVWALSTQCVYLTKSNTTMPAGEKLW